MIERVVENWLTSANERQYQIPFCQLLASEGETILHISTHGQLEQGKDIITRFGTSIRAYQLKTGALALNDWREYKGEIDELVLYPVEHPSVRSGTIHEPFLVTNGRASGVVVNAIRSANKVWTRQGAKPLRLVVGDELVSRFVKAHGSFLPREPEDFVRFLDLIVKSGKSPLDKKKLASLIESILLPIKSNKAARQKEIQRSVASAVLLTTYVLQGTEKTANHWAIFEAWTMMAVSIVMIAEKHGIDLAYCNSSLSLCMEAATRSLDNLAAECRVNTVQYTQGNPFTDGEFYRARITILCGLLAAASLAHRLTGKTWAYVDFVHNFLLAYLPRVRLWGESAVPYLILAALECEQHGNHKVAEGLVLQLADTIARTNGEKGRGLPSVYYGPESAIRLANELDPFNPEVFAGHSYTLENLIQFLARRWDRRSLAGIWERVTHLNFARFEIDQLWEFFRWKSDAGKLISTIPGAPQSWSALLEESERPSQLRVKAFDAYPQLALFFSLVYPQRFTPELLKLIEMSIRSKSNR